MKIHRGEVNRKEATVTEVTKVLYQPVRAQSSGIWAMWEAAHMRSV